MSGSADFTGMGAGRADHRHAPASAPGRQCAWGYPHSKNAPSKVLGLGRTTVGGVAGRGPRGSALLGSGHEAKRRGSIPAEPTAFRKPTSEARPLGAGPAARAGVGGGLCPHTTAVIGSSPAPLGASPLVSMATPLLSKQTGASFYEIFKPNFAVWVHIHSRGPGDTGDQARQWEAIP